ncbi:hypothetical protein QBC47DRAFT_413411 [Echria macrotheca]|uniref:G-patch domain-containing protein n=1 Tax=Echria macrotheca TaxID=438768 RepID=A0AAJ0FBR9_9PEZI|nr:hypothetical protein QBC47DRAFT_413411 [Echria macrotheca]
MSHKRSRAAYEADLTAQQSPFVVFGTPLPPLDPDVRDDGSYVPVWKQEVRDEKGRKRFHGAFTGGFSAGYFNTVGSKEGWTPSTFVSSRSDRQKNNPNPSKQRVEDFMDEEDLADAEESRKLQTTAAFAGLGSTQDDVARTNSLMGLFLADGDTMGVKLLRKMGWKDGQGIGPKVRRSARLELRGHAATGGTFLFAPENVPMITFVRKTDHKGLGFSGGARLSPLGLSTGRNATSDDEDGDETGSLGRPRFSLAVGRQKAQPKNRGGIGIGILNDTGSDDEDPYEIRPKISYNRVIGGDRKKIKANPSLKTKPTFIPKKFSLGKVGLGARKCHDGRLPLDGFVFGKDDETLAYAINSERKYPPPQVPPDWVSSRTPNQRPATGDYVSTADAAKASTLDPGSRAALLGEKQLPGKSVFDFMSAAARERLVAATGKIDLPPARGEVPAAYALTQEQRLQELLSNVPKLDKETAVGALSRGTGIGAPYANDDEKRSRYRAYLEYQAGFRQDLPPKPSQLSNEEWLREFHEFYNCARIFKPMTGFMASRFTTSSSLMSNNGSGGNSNKDLLTKPPPKPQDPAEEAAKLGMFGQMTRSVSDFYPTRLLCKRFNVKPPAHVQPDEDATPDKASKQSSMSQPAFYGDLRSTQPISEPGTALVPTQGELATDKIAAQKQSPAVVVDASRNEALESARAGEEVFKAIFGKEPITDVLVPAVTVSDSQDAAFGPISPSRHSVEEAATTELPDSVPEHHLVRFTAEVNAEIANNAPNTEEPPSGQRSPPPQYPASEASGSTPVFRPPPPFSSLFTSPDPDPQVAASLLEPAEPHKHSVADAEIAASASVAAPAYAPREQVVPGSSSRALAATQFQDETKRALPRDTKGESSRAKEEDSEPPPAYSEGSSPLQSFTYLMAAAGGASSIITQVQQGGPPINTLGDVGADETITMDLRGTRFSLSRDELLTLPEFVLLSLFPNGLFPEGHMGGYAEGDAVQVDYDPASLQYMLNFFRDVAQSIPAEPNSSHDQDGVVPLEPGARDDSSRRAGIIVLREDLDFYAIPHKKDIGQAEMMEVKRAAARALLKQDGIFSGLKRSDEPGTTEAHLIEMLTAGGFNHDDRWGHRAGEPNKAVICSLALARLRSDIRGNEMGNSAVGMAQKLLLFWRKPARRCWWEGVELDNVEGLEGHKLKVWIRRVWTLEMSVIGLR